MAQGCRNAGGGERRADDAAQLDGHRRRLSSERRDSQLPFQERLADLGGVLFLRGRSVHRRRRRNRLFRRPGRAALVLRDVQRDDDDDFVLDYGAAVRARRIGARLLAAQFHDFRRILPFTVVHRRDNQPVPGVRREVRRRGLPLGACLHSRAQRRGAGAAFLRPAEAEEARQKYYAVKQPSTHSVNSTRHLKRLCFSN